MNHLQELARKISILQQYSHESGVKTVKSQAELLRNLTTEQTVEVLELVAANLKAGRQ